MKELTIGKKYKLKKFYDDGPGIDPQMIEFFGDIVTITRKKEDFNWYFIDKDGGYWKYYYSWFEEVKLVNLPDELFTM